MDGIQAAKIILELEKDQRIIFITAYMRTTISNSMRDLPGALEIISKPVDLDEMVRIVENPKNALIPSSY